MTNSIIIAGVFPSSAASQQSYQSMPALTPWVILFLVCLIAFTLYLVKRK